MPGEVLFVRKLKGAGGNWWERAEAGDEFSRIQTISHAEQKVV